MSDFFQYFDGFFGFLQFLLGITALIIFISYISKYFTEYFTNVKYEGRYFLHSFIIYSSSLILEIIYQQIFYERHSFTGDYFNDMLFVALLFFISFFIISFVIKYLIAKNKFVFVLGDSLLMLSFIAMWALVVYSLSSGGLNGMG
jgi:hypothetical protein